MRGNMQTGVQKNNRNSKIAIFLSFLVNFGAVLTYIEPFLRLNVPQKHLKYAVYCSDYQTISKLCQLCLATMLKIINKRPILP